MEVSFTPGEPDSDIEGGTAHFAPHQQKRLTYQGFGAKNWQSRSMVKSDRLPHRVDWTQGELVQEAIYWDAPQPKSKRLPVNAYAVHTEVFFIEFYE